MSRGGGRRKPGGKPKGAGGARPAGAKRAPVTRSEAPPAGRSGGARAGRQEAARRVRRQDTLRRWGLVGVAALIGVAALVVSLVSSAGDRRDEQRLKAILTAGGCTVDTRSDSGRDHVERPSYKVNPPAGGDHTPQAASPAVYLPEQVPPDGQLVHAMEHGFVILWYRPGVDQETVQGLEKVAEGQAEATLVVPRGALGVPVAATAWHQRLLCPDGFEEKPLVEFIRAYQDKGPEKGFIE